MERFSNEHSELTVQFTQCDTITIDSNGPSDTAIQIQQGVQLNIESTEETIENSQSQRESLTVRNLFENVILPFNIAISYPLTLKRNF